METCEIVYRLSSDGKFAGHTVEARELAEIMYSFAEVVQASLDAVGEEGSLNVSVRPFKEGSFITEFVLTYGQQAVNFFTSPEGATLTSILTILGFTGSIGESIPKVIRKVRGRIDRFKENADGSVTYGEGDESITVDGDTHKIIQSPSVAKPYKATTIGPLLNIDKSITVNIMGRDEYLADDFDDGSLFDSSDIGNIETYEEAAISDAPLDIEDVVSISHDVALMPLSGSYIGGDRGYSFKHGDDKLRNVTLKDDSFREKLESNEIRLGGQDVLIVDMEATQSLSASGNINIHYTITKVKRYIQSKPPIQETIEGI